VEFDLTRSVAPFAGLPAYLHFETLAQEFTSTLERIADYDPTLLPANHPARERAERIAALEVQHREMKRRPVTGVTTESVH
jgi:hypothetical protein